MKKNNWKKYTFEFLSIFIAVISAFTLNNWNDNRKENRAESKILLEILNGITKDLIDIDVNKGGHIGGINACKFWRGIIRSETQSLDSLPQHYLALTRDFTSIQNTSGYETLKSRGFELIDNDSLRLKIISLYEFNYQTLRKLEEEYHELQFQENYFAEINKYIAPHFVFDSTGNIKNLHLPISLAEKEKNLLLSYLWKIQMNRKFVMYFYDEVKGKINELQEAIKMELEQ
ncbi:MAG: hypothetical protein WAT79_10050 [Saprospiraceae bacterium]